MSGSLHWFASHSFNLDWSFYLRADKAVKCSYGGFDWDDDAFAARVDEAATQLEILLDPGTYDGRGTDSRRLPGALVVDFTFNL